MIAGGGVAPTILDSPSYGPVLQQGLARMSKFLARKGNR